MRRKPFRFTQSRTRELDQHWAGKFYCNDCKFYTGQLDVHRKHHIQYLMPSVMVVAHVEPFIVPADGDLNDPKTWQIHKSGLITKQKEKDRYNAKKSTKRPRKRNSVRKIHSTRKPAG